MKVIKQGKKMPKSFKWKCSYCDCTFLVEENDYQESENSLIGTTIEFYCPCCKQEIVIGKRSFLKFWF